MSKALIPLPSAHAEWREKLFTLSDKVEMTPEEFEIYWPLVDSVYSRRQKYTTTNGLKTISRWECRLKMSRKSSTKQDKPGVKRRATSAHVPGLCQVEIRVVYCHTEPNYIIVERKNAASHSHTIDESFKRKLPSIVRDAIQREADKLNAPAQIFRALKGGTGSAAVEGPTTLEIAGGGSHIINAQRRPRIRQSDNNGPPNGALIEENRPLRTEFPRHNTSAMPDNGHSIPTFTAPSPTAFESPVSAALMSALSLSQHPEGGYFRGTNENSHPSRESFAGNDATRAAFTSIYHLLTPHSPVGHWHRNKTLTVHSLHRGRGRYLLIHEDGSIETFIVGRNVERGERLQWIVGGGVWKCSFLMEEESGENGGGLLITEVVVPGFEFRDHEFLRKDTLEALVGPYRARKLESFLRREGERN
ncbi:hypothetical protein RUND412_007387 [Rhizina undulata]